MELRRFAYIGGLVSAEAVILSVFMPWLTISVPMVGTIFRTGMDLSDYAKPLLAGGVAVAVLWALAISGTFVRWFEVASAAVGYGGIVAFEHTYSELQDRLHSVGSESATDAVGTGLWICGAGAVGLLVFAAMAELTRRSSESAPPAEHFAPPED
jgi:Na+/H+-translocating membrane pyrophosphatase